MRVKTSMRVKVVCFAFWGFFYSQNLFIIKKLTAVKLSWRPHYATLLPLC